MKVRNLQVGQWFKVDNCLYVKTMDGIFTHPGWNKIDTPLDNVEVQVIHVEISIKPLYEFQFNVRGFAVHVIACNEEQARARIDGEAGLLLSREEWQS